MKAFFAPLSIVALGVTMSTMASAHHSAAAFDFTKLSTVSGSVVTFDVINPHSHIVLRVTDAKGTRDIAFEGHSASNFYRAGWRRNSVNYGDKITVSYAPRRDGQDGGFVSQFKTSSGQIIGFGNLSPSTGKPQ